MTPSEIITLVQQKYNATNDTFFSQAEILNYMTEACNQISRECSYPIERTYTTTSTAGTQEYSFPTNTIAIKRVQYDGQKLSPITFRQDDSLTNSDQDTTEQGRSLYYIAFNYTLILRPIPDTSGLTIKIWSLNMPQALAITSTLEIHAQYHYDLSYFILSQMAFKDKNFDAYDRYIAEWKAAKQLIKIQQRKQKRSDGFNVVQDESTLPITILGVS